MSNKNKKTNLLVWSVVAVVAMVVLSVVGFVLAMTGVFAVNEFLLGFMILTAGLGIVFFVYGLVVKGGYETATGYILFCIGLTLLFVAIKLEWYGILIIDAALKCHDIIIARFYRIFQFFLVYFSRILQFFFAEFSRFLQFYTQIIVPVCTRR